MYSITENKQTITSREIAQMAGKNHAHVMRDIRSMEDSWVKFNQSKFGLVEYTDKKGEKRPEYLLTKTECLYIATKFNDEARARLVLRWEQLELEAFEKALKEATGSTSQPAVSLPDNSERVKAFWAFADNHKSIIKSTHAYLYISLLRYAEQCGAEQVFSVDWTVMLQYCGLSRNTYYKCMNDLHRLGVIEYTKGLNNVRTSQVKLLNLSAAVGAVPGSTLSLFPHHAAPAFMQPKSLINMPKEIIKIKFNEQEIKELIAEHYGLKSESAELLFSYYQGSSENDPSSVSVGIELSEQELKEIIAEKYRLKTEGAEIQVSYDKSYSKQTSKTYIIVEGEREEGN